MKLIVLLLVALVGTVGTLELIKKNDGEAVENIFDKLRKRVTQSCVDNNTSCRSWALIGECTANPAYMRMYCRKSCGVCKSECWDKHCSCPTLAARGHCLYGSRYYSAMAFLCGESCNFC